MVERIDFYKKGLILRIPTEVYPPDILIVLGGVSKSGKKKLRKIIGKESFSVAMGELEDYGHTSCFSDGCSLVRMNEIPSTPKDVSVLVHEIFHAARHALNHVNVYLSDDSEEAFAYLISYVAEKVFDAIRDWNKEFNKSE